MSEKKISQNASIETQIVAIEQFAQNFDNSSNSEEECVLSGLKFFFNIYYFIMIILKIFFQIIEFYLIIIITNQIVEYNIIFICSIIHIKALLIFSLLFSILFCYISVNLLTVYYFELFQFSWINESDFHPAIIKDLDNIRNEDSIKCNKNYLNIIVIMIRFIYFILPGEDKESLYMFFLILVPAIKIFNIYIAIISNKAIEIVYMRESPFIKLTSTDGEEHSEVIKMMDNINQYLTFKKIIMIICLLYHLTISIIKKSIPGCIYVVFIYLFCAPFFLYLKIEPLIFSFEKNSSQNKINRKIKRSTIIVIIFYSFVNIFFIKQIYGLLFTNSKNNKTIQGIFNITNNFTGNHWPENNNKSNQDILSSVCYTKIHYLNFIQLTALANAAYLEDEINSEQNIINTFKLSIFNQINNNVDLKNITFLSNSSDLIIILKADFQVLGEKPLTIISIKGSTTPFDFLLDSEMFISSALFSIAKKIPLLFKSETNSSYIFNYLCFLPFKCLEKITLTKQYSQKIEKIFTELIKQSGYGLNERNYVFVGHSLGGGLAKLAGFKYKLQSFSISGPGFTPLEFYLGKRKKIFDKYFKTTFIDLVPDLDIVPRVEISGGAIYRVLCEKGFISCHEVTRTLCMLGVMCNQEHLTGDLCSGVYTNKEYENDFIKVKESKY